MNSKKCGKCGVFKSANEFYKRRSGKRAGQYYEKCSDCMKVRGREYYRKNHDRQLELAVIRRHRAYLIKRSYINKAKEKPCVDCGMKYPPYVMDFDHMNGQDKLNDVAYLASRNWSLNKIKAEIEKCDVVCANCHRIRTYKKLARVAKVVTAGL